MFRLLLHSRRGNRLVAIVGAVYSIVALTIFVAFVVDNWNANGPIDILMQATLLACAACGIWFIVTGLESLGVWPLRTRRLRRN